MFCMVVSRFYCIVSPMMRTSSDVVSKVSIYISSPHGLVRYSESFNNRCRFELGFSDGFVS